MSIQHVTVVQDSAKWHVKGRSGSMAGRATGNVCVQAEIISDQNLVFLNCDCICSILYVMAVPELILW